MRKAKFRSIVPCLALLLALASCGRSGADPAQATETAKDPATDRQVPALRPPTADAGKGGAAAASPIAAIAISPLDPTREATVTAAVKTNPAQLPENMKLQYIFWLNAAKAQKSIENTFTLAACKKNDVFYIDAVLLKDGREICRKRSEMVKILNSSPRIKSVDFPEIKGSGAYTIKIDAFDPDGDPLSYSLEGDALPTGATIDANGAIKIILPEKPPGNIVFWAVVRDNDQGESKQEIKIMFTKRPNAEK